jgi:threonine dehydrogenase-like Zn-dependent dehydrogenase
MPTSWRWRAAMGAEVVDLARRRPGGRGAALLARARRRCGADHGQTKSNEPVHQAAQMCRKRGRIVLVGVTGLEFRAPISSRRS